MKQSTKSASESNAVNAPRHRTRTPEKSVTAPTPDDAMPPRDAGRGGVGLRVRMYRVGFGDFFLLSVPFGGDHEHILIDCGAHHADIDSIDAAVVQMARDCGGKLALIIMTHRHADHISGFAKCRDVFGNLSVDAVWMPWFEDPENKDAMRVQARLTAMAQQLKTNLANPALAAAGGEDLHRYRFMAANITGDDRNGGGSNEVALSVLKSGFASKHTQYSYYKAGDEAQLPQALIDAGLTAQILGPPDDLKLIGQMRKASEEYLADDIEDQDAPFSPFHPIFRVDPGVYDPEAFKYLSVEDIRSRFLDFQLNALAASALNADKFLNNQSLIVLFRFKDKSLLFVGDAQWGNWQNFLFGGAYGSDGRTEVRAEAREILKNIDFYKVGHHGSANSTPVDAVKIMQLGCAGCVAMCSTQTPAYNEVPREPLLDALRSIMKNHVARSDQVKAGKEPPNEEAGPLDALFITPTGELFIDYNF
jgi:beta-lactamase superfamily II metal-dependent hydrolase